MVVSMWCPWREDGGDYLVILLFFNSIWFCKNKYCVLFFVRRFACVSPIATYFSIWTASDHHQFLDSISLPKMLALPSLYSFHISEHLACIPVRLKYKTESRLRVLISTKNQDCVVLNICIITVSSCHYHTSFFWTFVTAIHHFSPMYVQKNIVSSLPEKAQHICTATNVSNVFFSM
jgi:hypothetical protein